MPTLTRLLDHDAWATRQLLECCRDLTDEQFHRRFDIGPGSLHDTLRHVIGAMARWADRIGDADLRPSPEADPTPRSVDELLAMHDVATRDLAAVARRVHDEQRLEEILDLTFAGRAYQFTRGTAIVHVCTHGTHHRAQCLNMLRRLAVPVERIPEIAAIDWELAMQGLSRRA
ncbi:MAG: DinB family protein [Planctomycetota bacterium]|jgi:uncharacterized damage-inducible protein DinB